GRAAGGEPADGGTDGRGHVGAGVERRPAAVRGPGGAGTDGLGGEAPAGALGAPRLVADRDEVPDLVGAAERRVLAEPVRRGGGPLPHLERLAAVAVDELDAAVGVDRPPLLVGAPGVGVLTDLGAVGRGLLPD